METQLEIKKIKLSDELKKQGISQDICEKVQIMGKLSPAITEHSDKPVTLIPNVDIFWILKNPPRDYVVEKGKLVTITYAQAVIARAKYLISHIDDEIAEYAKVIEESLIFNIKKQANTTLDNWDTLCLWRNGIYTTKNATAFEPIFFSCSEQWQKDSKKTADEFFSKLADEEQFAKSMELIRECLNAEAWDELYIGLVQKGIPKIASFKDDNAIDMDFMSSMFSKTKIDDTITSLKELTHIQKIAFVQSRAKYFMFL